MEILMSIFRDRMHENIVMDIVLKLWIGGLLALWFLGMIALLWGIISGEADIENATFGVFDTLG